MIGYLETVMDALPEDFVYMDTVYFFMWLGLASLVVYFLYFMKVSFHYLPAINQGGDTPVFSSKREMFQYWMNWGAFIVFLFAPFKWALSMIFVFIFGNMMLYQPQKKK